MTMSEIEDWRSVVETMLFSDGLVIEELRIDAQNAFAQLMQELEYLKSNSSYSEGYRAGWNDAIDSSCLLIKKERR